MNFWHLTKKWDRKRLPLKSCSLLGSKYISERALEEEHQRFYLQVGKIHALGEPWQLVFEMLHKAHKTALECLT